MANTTFTNSVTLTDADWFNDVNDFVYDIVGDGTDPPSSVAVLLSNIGANAFPAMWIQGLTYANNSTDPTNDIGIASGQCRSSDDVDNIVLSSITKKLDVVWAVGTDQGGLDVGAIGNSDYYIWAIKRPDTNVTDVLYSLSSTAPTMPADYTLKRLIGWFKRVGGTIVTFVTYEELDGKLGLSWKVPTLDVNLAATLTSSRRTDAVKVPRDFSVIAHLNVEYKDANNANFGWICCPDQTDAAPADGAAPLGNLSSATAGIPDMKQMRIRTSATGTIAARSNVSTVDLYAVSTMGFTWARRN